MTGEHGACCTPSSAAGGRGHDLTAGAAPAPRVGGRSRSHAIEQCRVPSQTFAMGDARGDSKWADGEGPVHTVTVSRFDVDATAVTNADFMRFVDNTGYVTEAESFGYSAVFDLALAAPRSAVMGPAAGTPWWLGVMGADWRHPGGPDSSIDGLDDHPVVHVSWNDAMAYCDWAGRALPTEAQWECASRAGHDGLRYPWGDELDRTDRCNIWQGQFPAANTMEDGYLTTAPVRSYASNDYGLWQTVGNVWEWCWDWWREDTYAISPVSDPSGPERGSGKVMRGGSYLCHDSYCNRYRNAARSSNTPDSSTGNTGFRTVTHA